MTAVAFALATFASGLAATTFDQLPAAALGFGAFLLAWNRRPLFAGLLAGLAVTTEYQAALVAVLLAVYVGVRGLRSVVEYAIGAFVGVVPLALYDWAAFGSPLHASYRYVANGYKEEQASGFFGISTPRFGSIHDVLIGDRGLLITSPVLLIAALGLAILFVRRPREALVAIFVSASFLLLEFGYFLPYGGISPGPRFFAPALPFLLLGLVPAWEKLKPVASAALLVSVLASTTVALTWSLIGPGYRGTVWGELAHTAVHSHSHLRGALVANILTVPSIGVGPVFCALLVVLAAASATAVALRSGLRDA
ncbi:MAG: hypothetical protein ACXVRK_01775 [Gaiellaceae bacterium]